MSTELRRPAWSIRFIREVAGGVWSDDCLGLAAEIAYFGLFSLFPFLLFLRALVPYVPGSEALVNNGLEALATWVRPDSRLYEIVSENVIQQVNNRSQALISIGVVLTLWSASSVFMVLIKAINRAYGLIDTRSWVRRRGLSFVLTLVMMVFVPSGLLLMLLGPWLGRLIGEYLGFERQFDVMWAVVRWPLAFAFLTLALAVFYFFGPNTRQRWHWLTPGSVLAVLVILLESRLLSWVLGSTMFTPDWVTFGAIGAAIIIVFWLYLIGFSILLGAEVNAAIGRMTGRILGST